jgi:hypothetical protein
MIDVQGTGRGLIEALRSMYLERLGKTTKHRGQDMVISGPYRTLKTESSIFFSNDDVRIYVTIW